jgi:hypothetical protein
MAGNQTVKDLDQRSQVTEQTFAYFPIWYIKYESTRGEEEIMQFPAAATSITEIRRVRVPAGDLRVFDESLESQSQLPTVPLKTALGWLEERGIVREQINELAVVHVPLFFFRYNYQGDLFSAVVEGATGEVFANIFPAKSESPYRIIAASAALVFLCLATFPVIGSLLGSGEGLAIGFLVCTILGVLAAPILFAIAAWVAAKI